MGTIWSSKGFGFDQHIAEKPTTLLVQATFGHTVYRLIHLTEIKETRD